MVNQDQTAPSAPQNLLIFIYCHMSQIDLYLVNSPPPEGGGFVLRLEAGSFSLKAEGRKTRVRQ
jgi:hypothetical protein